MAGQGTLADEIVMAGQGPYAYAFLQVGGGGMAAACAWLKRTSPRFILLVSRAKISLWRMQSNGKTDRFRYSGYFCDGTAVRKVGKQTYLRCYDR